MSEVSTISREDLGDLSEKMTWDGVLGDGKEPAVKDERMCVLKRGQQRQRPRDGEGREHLRPLGSLGSCTCVHDETFPDPEISFKLLHSLDQAVNRVGTGPSPTHFPHLEKVEFKKEEMTCTVSTSEKLS